MKSCLVTALIVRAADAALAQEPRNFADAAESDPVLLGRLIHQPVPPGPCA
jgi:hypothetical protein